MMTTSTDSLPTGSIVYHPLYGKGQVCSATVAVDTLQWTGSSVFVTFDKPQTAIAAGYPYMVPVTDLSLVPIEAPVPHEDCTQNAKRYKLLREMDWFTGPLCVVSDPQIKGRVTLGVDCPSRERLDERLDAILASKKAKSVSRVDCGECPNVTSGCERGKCLKGTLC